MKLTKDRQTPLQKEIDQLVEDLGTIRFDAEPESEAAKKTAAYSKKVEMIERLKDLHDDKKSREPINPNTIINVAGSLLGIAAILTYEVIFNGVITSKALGFVLRSRV